MTADDQFKNYGESDPKLSYSFAAASMGSTNGLVNGDTFNGTLTRTAGESLGNYIISANALTNGNYLISFNDGRLTIGQKPDEGVNNAIWPAQHQVTNGINALRPGSAAIDTISTLPSNEQSVGLSPVRSNPNEPTTNSVNVKVIGSGINLGGWAQYLAEYNRRSLKNK